MFRKRVCVCERERDSGINSNHSHLGIFKPFFLILIYKSIISFIMESTNLHHHHHHQLQDLQLVGSSPSNCYGVDNTPNTILNPSNIGPLIISPRDTTQENDYLAPPHNTSIFNQGLGFQWENNNITESFTTQLGHDLHLARIKGEFSDSYQKFTEMLQSSPSNIEELHFNPLIKDEQGGHLGDVSEKLLLRNFSSGCQINGVDQFPVNGDFYTCLGKEITPSIGNFSQIFPTINVSNLNRLSQSASSSSLDANMQALDLLNSGRFVDEHNFYKENFSNYGLDHMQQASHRPSNSLNKVSPINSGITEAKRRSTSLEPKVPQKKSRSESRTSCPPFKVRKEKLGDRIAALQQLVAPFGKTDTASVLMEAIGYIKFLQNQVETLSVPYMKSSRNKSSRTMMPGSILDGSEEAKRDLRSRGLCLVPLSCLSYITDGGGGVWPPPNFSN